MRHGKKTQDKSDGMQGPERVSAELQSMELNHGQKFYSFQKGDLKLKFFLI